VNSNIKLYAETLCDGLNEFLNHSELSMDYEIQNESTENATIIFYPKGDFEETAKTNKYSVSDKGETIYFQFEDAKLSVSGTVKDWAVFDLEEHTGEAISCIIQSTV
jgi:hypothetical protein